VGYGDNLNFERVTLKHWDTTTLSGGDIVVKCDEDAREVGSCFAQITASTQDPGGDDDDETCMAATLSRKVTLVGIAGVAEYFEIEFWYRFKDIDPADTMEIIIEEDSEKSNLPLFQETIVFNTTDTGWVKGVASLGYHVANDQKVVLSMSFSVANGMHGTGGCISIRNSQGLLDGINVITFASQTLKDGGYGDNLNFEHGSLKHWDTATLSGGEIVVKCEDDAEEVEGCFAQITASTQDAADDDDDDTCMAATLSRKVTLVGITSVAEYFEIDFVYRFKNIDPADTMEIIIKEDSEESKPPLFQETITAEDTDDTGWLKDQASLGYHVANDQKVVLSMTFRVANGIHDGAGGCISIRNSQGLLGGINIVTYASAPSDS
jgi:hypothetical protein